MNRDVKPLGKTGEKIPSIGLGTKGIQSYRLAEEALRRGFELGLSVVEVSSEYGNGLAEELVGRVSKHFKRDEIFVIYRLRAIDFSDYEGAAKALLRSLNRMSLSYVDVVLLYGVNEVIPLELQIKALEGLVDRGLCRYIGLSNYRLKDVVRAMGLSSKHEIVMLQAKYNVLDRKVERDVLKFALDNNIAFVACSPLERGAVKRYPKLAYLSNKYGKSPVQIALNYIISHDNAIAVPKSEKVQHVDEIYGALGWRLNIEDIKFLREQY